jgi:hypothetical protein
MNKLLQGKKTYFTAAAAILTALGMYAGGEATVAQVAQMVITALLAAFLRNGIASS